MGQHKPRTKGDRNIALHQTVPAQNRDAAEFGTEVAEQRHQLQMVPHHQNIILVRVEHLTHPVHIGPVAGRDQVVIALAFQFITVDIELVDVPYRAEIDGR